MDARKLKNKIKDGEWVLYVRNPQLIYDDAVELLGKVEYAGRHKVIIQTSDDTLVARDYCNVKWIGNGTAMLWLLENAY
jgi:hypothetical protein